MAVPNRCLQKSRMSRFPWSCVYALQRWYCQSQFSRHTLFRSRRFPEGSDVSVPSRENESGKSIRNEYNTAQVTNKRDEAIFPNLDEKSMIESNAAASLALRHVCHATFDELSEAGYSIQSYDDGAMPLQINESMLHGMPDEWKKPEEVIVPKVATLKDVTVFADGSALLPNGLYCHFDSSFHRYCSDQWHKTYQRWGRSRMHFLHPEYNDALIMPHPNSIAISGRCFAALHNYSDNFGHFVHDILSRIYYEDLGAIAPGREKVIAPRFRFPMQKILFEKLFANYEIVHPPAKTALEVEELVLPANLCSSNQFNPLCIAALANKMRDIMSRHYSNSEKYKICVSRRDGRKGVLMERNPRNSRNFINMEEFETWVEKFGYQVVEASKLKQESQLALWANTTDIIGVHGAGLMNFIMMLPCRDVTEIAGAPHPIYTNVVTPKYIARCAVAFGHRVNVVASKRDVNDDPEIDLDRLRNVLS